MEKEEESRAPEPTQLVVTPSKPSKPVDRKDTLQDYLSGSAFLWYTPNQIIGVRLVNGIARYALFDHARRHQFQDTISPVGVKATAQNIQDLATDFCPLTDGQGVKFKRFCTRPGCTWWTHKNAKHLSLIQSNEQLLWRVHDLVSGSVYFTHYENALLVRDYTSLRSKLTALSQHHVELVHRFHLQSLRIVRQRIQELIFIYVPWKSHLKPTIRLTADYGAVTIINAGSSTGCGPNVVGHAELVMETVEKGRYFLHCVHISESSQTHPKGTPAQIKEFTTKSPIELRYDAKGKTLLTPIDKICSIKDQVRQERAAYARGTPIVFFQLVPTGNRYNCSRWCYEKLCDAGIDYATVVSRAALRAEGVSRLTVKYSAHQLQQALPHIADFAVRNLVTGAIAGLTNGRAIVHLPAGCVSELIKALQSRGLNYHPTPDFSLTLNRKSALVRLCVEGTYLFQPSALVRPVLKRLKPKS